MSAKSTVALGSETHWASGLLLLYLTRFWVELVVWPAVELLPCAFKVDVLGLGGRLLGALDGRPPTVEEVVPLTNLEADTLGLWVSPTPPLMWEVPPMTLYGKTQRNQ